MDIFSAFLQNPAGWLPHSICIAGSTGLLGTLVAANTTIALAYFSIPLAIVHVLQRRPGVVHPGLAGLFGAFIFACGLTHLLHVWTLWRPDYAWQALADSATALISLATALALWRWMPAILAIPTVRELQAAIAGLEAEVRRRRTAEEHLRDLAQSLAVTLGSIDAGFVATDRQGRITRMNGVAERVTERTQDSALGCPLRTVLRREDLGPADLDSNPVEEMIARGITVDTLHRPVVVGANGLRTPLELRAALTHDEQGAVQGLALVFRDLTRLQQDELALRQLAAIVGSSFDAIIGKTLEGYITSWNAAAERLFGYSAVEAIGQPVQMLLPPERMDEEMRILQDLAMGRQIAPFDTVRRRKDGSVVEVSVTISPICDAAGQVVGASKVARDITLRKQAEAAQLRAVQLETENRQIQAANQLKSQFLANMSHELRTPLNAVIGFADLLLSGAVPEHSPKRQEFLGHIASSGRHLLQLINDVLDLSKVESGKFEFFPEPVDLPTLVQEVMQVLETGGHRKRLTMTSHCDPGLEGVVLDPSRLKQALFNFVSNAIKFTPEGGRIDVWATSEGADWLRVEVADTGVGIAEADLPRLFVEFQQLDAGYNKQHPGTGLGLALTRRLVQAQGGRVGVSSQRGQGSVFHLVLPRRPELAGSARPSLLVVAPPGALQSQLAQAGQSAGLQVDTAADAPHAALQARLNRYQAITMDLMLPGQRGWGLLSSLRTDALTDAAPVIGMTWRDASGVAGAFPIANVLGKPLRSGELLSALALCGVPARQDAWVMVIDDDPAALALAAATLQAAGVASEGLLDGRQALHRLLLRRPDAIILDLMMPGCDGFQVLQALARAPGLRDIPVLIWTSMLLTEEEHARLLRSAQAVVQKGGGTPDWLLERLSRWQPGPMLAVERPA
jgi:PAS domain S-box-containing protein